MAARSIMEMNDKYALIFHRDFPPMKVLRLKWWQSEMIAKRHSLEPPDLPTLPEVSQLPERSGGSPTFSSPPEYINPDMILPLASREIPILDLSGREQEEDRLN
jgi:hypothetical protein